MLVLIGTHLEAGGMQCAVEALSVAKVFQIRLPGDFPVLISHGVDDLQLAVRSVDK